jgi:hypothetical protein
MKGFTAGEAAARLGQLISRPIDAMVFNDRSPGEDVLWRYARESKAPLELGDVPDDCEVISGGFMARADRPARSLASARGHLGRAGRNGSWSKGSLRLSSAARPTRPLRPCRPCPRRPSWI